MKLVHSQGIRKVYHEYGHTADNKSLVDNIDNAIESCRPCIRNNEAWNEKRSHSFNDYNVKLSEVPQTKQHGGERMSVIIFCTACAHKDCSLISTALRKSTRKCKMYSEILSLKSGKEYWANSEEKSVYKCITKQLEENSSYICLEDIAITKRPGEVADIYFLVFMCPFSKSMNEKYKTSNLQLIDTAYCSIEFVLNKLECFNFQISFSQTRKIANATATVYALEYYGLTRNDFPLLENFSQRETNQKFLSSSRGKITQNNVVTYTSDFEANVTNCSLGSTFSFVTTNSTQVNSLNDNFQELLSLSLRNYFITRPDLPMKNNTSTYQLESYLKGLQVFPDQRNTSICCDISQPIIVDNHSENFKTFNAHLSQARCKLSAACANDQVDEIEHIVNKYTVLCSTISNTLIINIRNEDGETPLIIACITRSSNAIRWLLKQSDIDVNATDEKSNTALHYVIITNRSGGRTQLHEACENGDFEKVKNMLYVTQRHDVNVQDNDGWTPLHLACFTGQEKIVSLLLWAGADVDIRDEDWRTPADVAEIANCDYLIDMLNLRPMADWRPAYFQFYIDLMNTSFNPDDDAT